MHSTLPSEPKYVKKLSGAQRWWLSHCCGLLWNMSSFGGHLLYDSFFWGDPWPTESAAVPRKSIWETEGHEGEAKTSQIWGPS